MRTLRQSCIARGLLLAAIFCIIPAPSAPASASLILPNPLSSLAPPDVRTDALPLPPAKWRNSLHTPEESPRFHHTLHLPQTTLPTRPLWYVEPDRQAFDPPPLSPLTPDFRIDGSAALDPFGRQSPPQLTCIRREALPAPDPLRPLQPQYISTIQSAAKP